MAVAKGWTVYEDIGVAVVNPRGVNRMAQLMKRTDILKRTLWQNSVSLAVAVATYEEPGVASLYVVYADFARGADPKPLRLPVGEFRDGGHSCPSKDWAENLEEVTRSAPEEWADFLAGIPDALLVAGIMES